MNRFLIYIRALFFSQKRVLSYTGLLTGQTLAQRTIDKLGLDMSAAELQERVTATAKPDTVLIDVSVLDESPVRARDIANTLSDEFVVMAKELETPEDGSSPPRVGSLSSSARRFQIVRSRPRRFEILLSD